MGNRKYQDIRMLRRNSAEARDKRGGLNDVSLCFF